MPQRDRSMMFCKRIVYACRTGRRMQCTDIWAYSREVAVSSSPAPNPRPFPPSHKCILLLISWLHICLLVVVFSINKALIAFSLEHDLARCVPSFWGCWPWRTRLDYFTARSTGCYQTQALSQTPHCRHTTAKDKEENCRTKADPNGASSTHTDCTTMAEEY